VPLRKIEFALWRTFAAAAATDLAARIDGGQKTPATKNLAATSSFARLTSFAKLSCCNRVYSGVERAL
jgi:hypothetical protein